MPLTGNKGEWSEIYTFLKLLADGRLNAADENLNAIPEVYYPIIKILRQEANGKYEYLLNGNIRIFNDHNDELLSVPISEFVNNSIQLLTNLKNATGRSFQFPLLETFLNSIKINSVKSVKNDKADIKLIVHDLNTGQRPQLGFSIKSMLGQNSTLFNPAAGTNFIYKLIKPESINFNISEFNNETYNTKNNQISKISVRLNKLIDLGFTIDFYKIQSKTLELNLKLIDSHLPEILAYLLLTKYQYSISKLSDLLANINNSNPLNYDLSCGHPFYEYKIKNFLTENALGMTPETVFTGSYDANGGIIIVKDDGELVCYHIYNKLEFQKYLLNNTKLEQASTSEDEDNPGNAKTENAKPYKFGWVYEEEGQLFIKLNLQIRFNN